MQNSNGEVASNLNVMLYEQDSHYVHILREELMALGITHVVTVHSPEEALQIIQSHHIDVLVSELNLPLFRFIRTNSKSPNKRLPIVVATGAADYEHVAAARDAGINSMVTKPVSASGLFAHIHDALDAKHHPFVECSAYTGPERRHEASALYRGPERRRSEVD